MERRELPHHRESDPRSGHRRPTIPAQAPEAIPDPLAGFHWYTGTEVVDLDAEVPTPALEGDRDGLAIRTVLHRVVEQVEEHLMQRAGVHDRDQALVQHGPYGDQIGRASL